MAHIGKIAPLAFRRDLCMNAATNQVCFKKSYRLRAQGLAGTLGTALNGFLGDWMEPFNEFDNSMVWVSPMFSVGGFDVAYWMSLAVNTTTAVNEVVVLVEEASLGFVFLTRTFPLPPPTGSLTTVSAVAPDLDTPGVITSGSISSGFQPLARLWSDYP